MSPTDNPPRPATPPAGAPAAGAATPKPPAATPGAGGAAAPAAPPAKAAGDQSGALVTFKLKFIHQEERKTLTFEYHSSQAVQRTYAPQALFGLLADDLDRADAGYFTEVDLDDPFFRTFKVDAEVPVAMEPIGLRSVTVALDYGNPADPSNHRHTDLVFDREHPGPQTWEVMTNGAGDLGYTPRIEFNFDPQADWQAERHAYEITPGWILDRTLSLDPYRHLGFLQVDVTPDGLDPGEITTVEATLTYTAPNGWQAQRTFTVAPGAAAQQWRVRTEEPSGQRWSHQLVYHLAGGGQLTRAGGPTAATKLAVGDPFGVRLEPRFSFGFPAGTCESVVLDLAYDDADAGYHRELRLEVDGATLPPTTARIPVLDRAKGTYRVRATLLGPAGATVRGAETETDSPFVTIGPAGEVSG